MSIEHCRVCGSPFVQPPLLICKDMPAGAQHMPDKFQLHDDKKVDMKLYQCSGCGLVQFDAEPVWYYKDVIRSGGYSTTMVNLRHEQYDHFYALCGLKNKKVIEVGCGQGEFLRVWRQFGYDVEAYGIENDPQLVQRAVDDGLRVDRDFALDESTRLANGPYDAFCSFNFLEHQPDPNGMLRCIYQNTTEESYGLITVPSFEYIMQHNGFYELIRDHIANYTEESFRFVLEKNGFRVLELTTVNRDTHSAIVQKRPRYDLYGLQENRDLQTHALQEFFNCCTQNGRKAAIWGASHQTFTLLSNIGLERYISYVIDSAPFKQGKYTAGTHIPIISPSYAVEHPVDTILIVAPGYTDEICSSIRQTMWSDIRIATLRSDHPEILVQGWKGE